jgi:molecular chaperone GrpE
MKKQEVYNQDVNDEKEIVDGEGSTSCKGSTCDNVTEEQDPSTDTMSEPTEEQSTESPATDFEKEAAEWRDKYIRLQAEFDNFRKRTLREKMDLVQSGGADVLKSMLSVLDDVYRAVAASEKSEDITALREGEKLVAQKFCDALRQKGVTEIEAQDKEFDSDLHEAVARFAAGEDKRGKVIDVVQRGYMLGEKVLRYAKVVVGE